MKKNSFDSQIKKALESHQADLAKMDWLAMNEKLNATFGEEATIEENRDFDKNITEKLTATETSFNEAHWEKLESQLDTAEKKSEERMTMRIVKITALLLLLLSLWNWKGNSYIQQKSQPAQTLMAVNNTESSHQATNVEFFPQQPVEEILITNDKSHNNNINPSEGGNTRMVHNPRSVENSIATSQIITNSSYIAPEERTNHTLTEVYDNNTSSFDQFSLRENSIEQNSNSALQTIAHIATQKLDQEEVYLDLPLPLLNMQKKKKERTSAAFNIVASPDLYLIRSAKDPIYPLPSYMTDSRGLSGGFTISLDHNNVILETGLLYSSVTYAPREIKEQYSARGSFYETSLQNISFNVVSIPVHFKYGFDASSKSKIFGNFGASFNGVINSNFDQYDERIAIPLAPLAVPTRNESLLSQKDFEPGLLEGGSIFENTFFTVDLGLTYQHEVNERIAAFVQPTLHTQFTSGIGPNVDKLHKLSLYGGVKYRLN